MVARKVESTTIREEVEVGAFFVEEDEEDDDRDDVDVIEPKEAGVFFPDGLRGWI